MDSPSEDKQWASKYLLDPLNALEPSEETGPGSHFNNTVNRATSTSKGPSERTTEKTPSVSTYPTPPTSASPTQSSFHSSNPYSAIYKKEAFGVNPSSGPSRKSLDDSDLKGKGRRRGSSLGERYAGDMSHRPLDILRKESKKADRSPHLKKTHIPGADTIDSLDKSVFGGLYHHEGPYDATLLARNTDPYHSPIEAVKRTNAEALRATPREHVVDSLRKHVPLQGTAIIPPGMAGVDGKVMQYEEGADLMREADAPGGAYKRWVDINYLPEDYKGKGEPAFSIERALKEHKQAHRRSTSDDFNSIEMQPRINSYAGRQRSASGTNEHLMSTGRHRGSSLRYASFENDMRRSNTTGARLGEGLKRRFGSLRRAKKTEVA